MRRNLSDSEKGGFSDFLDKEFYGFTAIGRDRLDALRALLTAYSLPFSEVSLAGNAHLIVRFSARAYNPQFRLKFLLAHYDCAPGSPGANDNAAAVFQLIALARDLLLSAREHNVIICFTGAEELSAGSSVREQGSFALGFGLRELGKKIGATNIDVYVFDCCGRGDTFVVSQTVLYSAAAHSEINNARSLYRTARSICADVVSRGDLPGIGWIEAPIPYGDDAGLTASGFPSQTITILPHEEAEALMNNIREHPQLREALICREGREKAPETAAMIPKTWRLINGADDTPDTLTRTAFIMMNRFLSALSRDKRVI